MYLVRGRDGWLAVGGLNSATFRYHNISLDNFDIVYGGMGDGPRPEFRGQNLQYDGLDDLFVPAKLGMVGWMV